MKYNAFISYKHAPYDTEIAKKVHKGLETFSIPRSVRKKYNITKISRVFRDQEELPIGANLTDNITMALEESEFLIVICSPRILESEWCLKEIDTFIGLRGRNHVLAVLIEGEPADAFPPQLRYDANGNPVEPLAADLRARDDVKFNKLFKTELMRLCAPLIGCTYDELRQRHRERRIRRIAYISTAVAAVAVAFGGYATLQNARINENYQAKLINQSKFLANTSSELLEQGDRRAASFVAAEGLSVNEDKPFVASSAYQLAEALHVYDNGRNYSLDSSLEHEANVETMNANSDCSRVVSTDASYNAYMWDTVSGTQIGFVPAQVSEEGVLQKTKAAFCCGDNILVVYEKMVALFDCQGNAIWMYTDKKFNAYSASYNEDSDILAVTDSINGVYLFQGASGELRRPLELSKDDMSVGGRVVFSSDAKRCGVARTHSLSDAEYENLHSCNVDIIDLISNEITSCVTAESKILGMAFTDGGNLIVASAYGPSTVLQQYGTPYTIYIECFDKKGVKHWSSEFTKQDSAYNATDIDLATRTYEDESGAKYEQIYVKSNDVLLGFKETTGEMFVNIPVGKPVTKLFVDANSQFGYVSSDDGLLVRINMTTGEILGTGNINAGAAVEDFAYSEQVVCVKTYSSNRLQLVKHLKGTGVKTVASDLPIYNYGYNSSQGTYQAYSYSDNNNNYCVDFYSKDQFAGSITTEFTTGVQAFFISDSELLVAGRDGKIWIVDATSLDVKNYQKEEVEGWNLRDSVRSSNKQYIAFCEANKFCIFDVGTRSFSDVLSVGSEDNSIDYMAVSNDGKSLYINSRAEGLIYYDVNNNTSKTVEGIRMYKGDTSAGSLTLSSDDTRLLVRCSDCMLRVLDTSTHEVTDVIELNTGNMDLFAAFSVENKDIVLQGRDGLLRVYSLEEDRFTYYAKEESYGTKELIIDNEKGIAYTSGTTCMMILSADKLEPIARIDKGKAFNPATGEIYQYSGKNLYKYQYMDVNALFEELNHQYPNDGLTDRERLRYNLD